MSVNDDDSDDVSNYSSTEKGCCLLLSVKLTLKKNVTTFWMIVGVVIVSFEKL